MVVPAVIGGVASLAAGGLNYFGQGKANRMSRDIARESMDFSGSQASKQMEFQERMSNTSYQRAVADMQAAGLNPMLAYMQGGASQPAGAKADAVVADYKNRFKGAISSALEARSVAAQVKNVEANADIARAQLFEKTLESNIWKSPYGKALKLMQMLQGPVNSALSTVGKLFK